MKEVNNIGDALKQLEKLTPIGADGHSSILLEKDCNIRLSFEIHESKSFPVVQLQISLNTKDRKVWSWGAQNNKENEIIALWFKRTRQQALNNEDAIKEAQVKKIKQYLAD
jgi:hypothetical protein